MRDIGGLRLVVFTVVLHFLFTLFGNSVGILICLNITVFRFLFLFLSITAFGFLFLILNESLGKFICFDLYLYIYLGACDVT